MRVENHLLRLARIGANERHAAVAQTHVRDLHGRRHAVEHNDLVAPVELVGFARLEAQRHIGGRRQRALLAAPFARVATHGVIAARIAQTAQILENTDQGQPLARRLLLVLREQLIELVRPRSELGQRLIVALVSEGRLLRPQRLADRVP